MDRQADWGPIVNYGERFRVPNSLSVATSFRRDAEMGLSHTRALGYDEFGSDYCPDRSRQDADSQFTDTAMPGAARTEEAGKEQSDGRDHRCRTRNAPADSA
jgi:hypothetical protein